MPKQSAFVLALGFIIGSAIVCFGLMSLGKSIVFAGSASRPPDEIGLKIVGSSSGSAAPIGLQIKGDSNRDPILFIDKTLK